MLGHVAVAVVEAQPDDPVVPRADEPGQLLDRNRPQPGCGQGLHVRAEAGRRDGQLVAGVRDPVVEEDPHARRGRPSPRADGPRDRAGPCERRLGAVDGGRRDGEIGSEPCGSSRRRRGVPRAGTRSQLAASGGPTWVRTVGAADGPHVASSVRPAFVARAPPRPGEGWRWPGVCCRAARPVRRRRIRDARQPMCGIAGTAGGAPPDPDLLEAMADTMVKRGPDGEGTWHDDSVGLAFRRLAIIDLARALEPADAPRPAAPRLQRRDLQLPRAARRAARASATRSRTEGDAEVLLHAWAEWGEGALDRLNGMFALRGLGRRATRRADARRRPVRREAAATTRARGERLVFASDVQRAARVRRAASTPATMPTRSPPSSRTRDAAGRRRASSPASQRLPAAHVLRWQDGARELAPLLDARGRSTCPRDYDDAVAPAARAARSTRSACACAATCRSGRR